MHQKPQLVDPPVVCKKKFPPKVQDQNTRVQITLDEDFSEIKHHPTPLPLLIITPPRTSSPREDTSSQRIKESMRERDRHKERVSEICTYKKTLMVYTALVHSGVARDKSGG